MLGQLYTPKGLALETAIASLETEHPHACNIAFGCDNGCDYCFGPQLTHQTKKQWRQVRYPNPSAYELVLRQLDIVKPEGVFLSFCTDLFGHPNQPVAALLELLRDSGIKVATLSKLAVSPLHNIRHGLTLVSDSLTFWKEHEPNTLSPGRRLSLLEAAKQRGDYVWVSMEPYPVSTIYQQELYPLLEKLKFVDLILFGKWNYDARASTFLARQEYRSDVLTIRDFCKSNNIRLHVKAETMEFAFQDVADVAIS
jgi:DNA repair photolyase